MSEEVLYRTKPKMVKGDPVSFVAGLFMTVLAAIVVAFEARWWVDAFLILAGPVPFVSWWLSTMSQELVVTEKRTRKREGILSNKTTEIEHRDVENVQVEQGPIQNLTGTGTLRLSSAGPAGGELVIDEIEDPEGIRDLVCQQREEVREEAC